MKKRVLVDFQSITQSKFEDLYNQKFTHMFRKRVNFEADISSQEKKAFAAILEGNVCGIFQIYTLSPHVLVMHLSVIDPKYRRLGIYTQYLKYIIDYAKSCDYKQIMSEHSPTNSGIIIAKLRMGFYITNLQVNPYYGTEVQLQLFLDKILEEIFAFRCGDLSISKETAKFYSSSIKTYHKYFNDISCSTSSLVKQEIFHQ